MKLKDTAYLIDINIDDTYSLESTDNRHYDFIFNPESLTRNDFTKVFAIKASDGFDEPKNIALIGSLYSCAKDCAVLEDSQLIVLMNSAVTVIDLDTFKLIEHKEFSDFGCFFSIYPFDMGYLVYGELEIVKLNKNLEIEWDFSGADIFVSPDELINPFSINGDTIELYDWNGSFYLLDKSGNQINRTR
ncbi:MAG: hypothetical protein PHE79_01795 [Eubacteriales bacterium]|nr:hypothetical protein [Eubacteriales bacterium]